MKFSDFILAFPEFSDIPLARFQVFADQAEAEISDNRFGKSTGFGRMLYVAHFLTIASKTAQNANSIPSGAVSSKSVGGASISYDTASIAEADAGFWNATSYGRLFWGLLRRNRLMPFVVNGKAKCL